MGLMLAGKWTTRLPTSVLGCSPNGPPSSPRSPWSTLRATLRVARNPVAACRSRHLRSCAGFWRRTFGRPRWRRGRLVAAIGGHCWRSPGVCDARPHTTIDLRLGELVERLAAVGRYAASRCSHGSAESGEAATPSIPGHHLRAGLRGAKRVDVAGPCRWHQVRSSHSPNHHCLLVPPLLPV